MSPNLAEETKPLSSSKESTSAKRLYEDKADVDNQPSPGLFRPYIEDSGICRRVFIRPRSNSLATTIDRRAVGYVPGR